MSKLSKKNATRLLDDVDSVQEAAAAYGRSDARSNSPGYYEEEMRKARAQLEKTLKKMTYVSVRRSRKKT